MEKAPLACPRYSMYQAEELIKQGAVIDKGWKSVIYEGFFLLFSNREN